MISKSYIDKDISIELDKAKIQTKQKELYTSIIIEQHQDGKIKILSNNFSK